MAIVLAAWVGVGLVAYAAWLVFAYADSQSNPARMAKFNRGGRLFGAGCLILAGAGLTQAWLKKNQENPPKQ